MDAEAPAADPAPGATKAIERRRDAAAAGHAGDAAGARLHLGDDDPMVRSSALRALDRAGGLAASELEAALEDPAPAVRMTALELAAGRDDVPVAATAARLGDDDRRVVEAAAWACGERVSATDADGATADVLGDAAGSGTADVVGDADDGATADVLGDAAGSGTADVVAGPARPRWRWSRWPVPMTIHCAGSRPSRLWARSAILPGWQPSWPVWTTSPRSAAGR